MTYLAQEIGIINKILKNALQPLSISSFHYPLVFIYLISARLHDIFLTSECKFPILKSITGLYLMYGLLRANLYGYLINVSRMIIKNSLWSLSLAGGRYSMREIENLCNFFFQPFRVEVKWNSDVCGNWNPEWMNWK